MGLFLLSVNEITKQKATQSHSTCRRFRHQFIVIDSERCFEIEKN